MVVVQLLASKAVSAKGSRLDRDCGPKRSGLRRGRPESVMLARSRGVARASGLQDCEYQVGGRRDREAGRLRSSVRKKRSSDKTSDVWRLQGGVFTVARAPDQVGNSWASGEPRQPTTLASGSRVTCSSRLLLYI